jgi:guanylate kinase
MTLAPLILVSGPSGSGKSTLIRAAIARAPIPLRLAVSATTRPPRPGEVDGVDYHFWTPEQFQKRLAEGAFLEHAQVHGKHWYGTPRDEVDGYRERGTGVILDIDVQGAAQVRPLFPDHLSIFVRLADPETYARRLRLRGADSEETITRRMETAARELARVSEYQYVIYNDDLDLAVRQFLDLVERHRNHPPGDADAR